MREGFRTKEILFTKKNTAELADTCVREPGDNEVTVKLAYSIISPGTEKANIMGLKADGTLPENGDCTDCFPKCLGYSNTGIVVEKGKNVQDLAVGDRVVVYWGRHCGYVTVDAGQAVKIDDDCVGLDEAAFAFISAFPAAAIRKTKLEFGESALVMGLGLLGQLAVKLLRAAGAYPIVACDPVLERRNKALKFGADYAVDPFDADFAHKIKERTDGGAHVAVEVTGLGKGLEEVLDCTARFGRVALLGCTRNAAFSVDYYQKVHKPGIQLIGAHTNARPDGASYPGYWTHRDDIRCALRLLAGGRLVFSDMIEQVRSPADAPEVYARLVADPNFPIGVLFDWNLV